MRHAQAAHPIPHGIGTGIKPKLPTFIAGVLVLSAFTFVLGGYGSITASAQQTKAVDENESKAYQAAIQEVEYAKRAALLIEFLEKYPNSKLVQPIDHRYIKMLNRDEYNAYRAARQEPNTAKRAAMLIDFLQRYPQSRLLEKADYAAIKPLEDQNNAYNAVRQESDPEKRAMLMIDFLGQYPDSALVQNVDFEYTEMLKEAAQSKKYELLESLAEKWLKVHPKDRITYGLVAEATSNLKKYEKCGGILEEVYKMQPSGSLAKEIYATYQKTENIAKQVEWAQNLAQMPEYQADYMLQYDLVMKFSSSNNHAKAAEHARLTLKAADQVSRPDGQTEQLRKVRRACHHVIASELMEKGDYRGAISAFNAAIKAEKYGQAYYGIAVCLDNQKMFEEANLNYAAAELMGGETASKAKVRLEALYKALHNNTLVGIEKVYQKARELIGN